MFCWTHIFNDTNRYWENNQEYNLYFLKTVRRFTQDKFDFRGYIYMNEIYEAFGLEWHPEYMNPVFTRENQAVLRVEFIPLERTSDVRIEIYC